MGDFLKPTKSLSEKPEDLHLVIDLVLILEEHSYPRNYVHRQLYGMSPELYSMNCISRLGADTLLEELVKQALEEDRHFKPSNQLARLKKSIDY
jgi:hypothetical protein